MPIPLTPLRSHLLILRSRSKTPNLSIFTFNRHLLSTTSRHQSSSSSSPSDPKTDSTLPFRTGPSPPRLPKAEQDLFESLLRQSTGAFSTPREPPQINQSPNSTPSDILDAKSVISKRTDQQKSQTSLTLPSSSSSSSSSSSPAPPPSIAASGQGAELHPAVRRGAKPEFEGDVNPKTGEVGGPKNEPLRWGAAGEWGYNGRTTDF